MMLGFSFGWLFAGGSSNNAPRAGSVPFVPTMLWINDTPLQVAGVTLQQPSRWLDGASRALPDVGRATGLTGGQYGSLPTTESRDVLLECVMLGVTLEQEQAALAAFTDLLTGELELRWPHAPNNVMRGVAGPLQVNPVTPAKAFVLDMQRRVSLRRVSVTIRCADTAMYSREPRRVMLSTTPRKVRAGDLPVGGRIVVNGPHTGALDIDVLSPSGALLGRLALRDAPGLPVSLATGDTLAIRLDAPHLLTKRTAAGVETNVYAWRSLTLSSRWWRVAGRPGDPARDQHCLVRLSAGTGVWTYAVGYAH
ncbi:hypothetical protein [Gemmatimonas sp.]|jgi:hypothetical protein|uniref:hypothetical protein n=1 Tax=Gemmatimonas sp. TaxID=1962908 RepID=UPI0037C00C29